MEKITISWSQFKSLIDTKAIQWQYVESDDVYELTGYQGPESYSCTIIKVTEVTEKTDFETNYKSNYTAILKNATEIVNNITNPVSIVVVPAVTPSGGTKVSTVVYNAISSNSDSIYTIPNGETLVIQSLTGGCEFKSQGSSIELWYDPNGNGSGMTIIDVLHVNGTSDQHSIYASYIGNGTKKIRLRRRAYGGGSREVFARWEGYY